MGSGWIEEMRKSMPRHKMQFAHVLLVRLRFAHTRHPHLAKLRRGRDGCGGQRLDVLQQLVGDVLGQFVDPLKVVGQPVRFRVQMQEYADTSVAEAITILGRAFGSPVVHIQRTELADAGQTVKVTGHPVVGGVIGQEL